MFTYFTRRVRRFDALASMLIKLMVFQKALQQDKNYISQKTWNLCVHFVIVTCHHGDNDGLTLKGLINSQIP